VITNYSTVLRDLVTDRGFGSKENSAYRQKKGILDIVFNKVVRQFKKYSQQFKYANTAQEMEKQY